MSYHPTKNDQEYLEETIREITNTLFQFLGIRVNLVLVGSTAKGTWLVNEADIDIYVCHSLPEQDTFSLLKKAFPKGKEKQGQLKIWNFSYNGFDIDLVLPCKGKREDTIFHSDWFNRHLTDFMRAEIRTAKAYFKTKGVYGAEIGGIIGVAIEQLVILQGNFKAVCMILKEPKPYVQDPTMTTPRDLLASINKRRWKELKKASKEYLENPSFEYKSMTWLEFMSKYPDYCTIQFKRTYNRATDYQTVLKAGTKIKRIFRNEEPDVEVDLDVWVGEKIVMCYKVRPLELSLQKERCVDATISGAKKFQEVHKEAYFTHGLICAMVDRKILFPDTYFYSNVVKRVTERGLEQI